MNRAQFGKALIRSVTAGIATAMLCIATPAAAAPFVVDAFANSSSGGTGLATISLSAGQNFSTSASSDDLWSAGALPRWSDAGGLTGDRFATGTDESGAVAGTRIGMDFGLWVQHAIDAPFGSIVGEINGVFQELGLSYSGIAWDSGILKLYYWDSNNQDNSGRVTVDVTSAAAVPEPASIAFLGAGLVGLLRMRRRKRA